MGENEKIIESMSEKLGFTPKIVEKMKELHPEMMHFYKKCDHKILSDGVLPAKTKVLIALGIVASQRCETCVVSQIKNALAHGATKEEILEVLEVIFMTSGATAVAACRQGLTLLEDK
jgi:AhpD family alkylhydroperoxidase